MKKTFLFWLFMFNAFAFTVTYLFVYRLQTDAALDNAQESVFREIEHVKELLANYDNNIGELQRIRVEAGLNKAQALDWLIDKFPNIINENALMEQFLRVVNIDEYNISDERGLLTASYPLNRLGAKITQLDRVKEFAEALTDPNYQSSRDFIYQEKGIDKILSCFAIARRNNSGLIQIGSKSHISNVHSDVLDLDSLVNGLKVGENGLLIVVKDKIIVSAENKKYLNKPLSSLGFSSKLFGQGRGSFFFTLDEESSLMAYDQYNDYLIIGRIPQKEVFNERNSLSWAMILVFLILFGLVILLVYFLLKRIVINGMEQIDSSLKKITDGDLDEHVNVHSNPEFDSLSAGINTMVVSLKREVTDRLARMEKEVDLAAKIQMSVIPKVFPPFPERHDFDLYGTLHYAKEVGGDYFGFMLRDDDHLAFIIADVSGKGIPAAMFMMVVKIHIRSLIYTNMSLAEILHSANDYLCQNNEAGMFVTVFLGLLELSTGKLDYVDAAHPFPIIISPDQEESRFIGKNGENDIMVGLVPKRVYTQRQTCLKPGEKLLLYTDGATEAVNKNNQLYGEERLFELVTRGLKEKQNLGEMINLVNSDIKNFYIGCKQADDITFLLLEYKGPESR